MAKKSLAFILVLLFVLVSAVELPAAEATSGGETLLEEIWVTGSQLGLSTTNPSMLSPTTIIRAPLPFNAVVPQWLAAIPEGASLTLYLRTGNESGWGEWQELQADADLTLPDEENVTGQMIFVDASGQLHDRVELRLERVAAPSGQSPSLERLGLSFIDSTAGPTTQELLAQQQQQPQPAEPEVGYPKPPVISRSVWCTDPDCYYTDDLRYYPVSHLILHHTVTSTGPDSAAIMRAIWKYHTYSNGWGDIGYNYLVDVNGVIFEGHLGGDNVIGTHTGSANRGGMALSLIGNFETLVPPQAMINAVADLFSWKADQQQIDVYDSGSMPDMDWGLPYLMGHRDAYGTTACPGEEAHDLLPAIRAEIARRIGFTPPHFYYDEWAPESNFSRSAINWLDGPRSCGYNGHAYYTESVQNPAFSTNWGEWHPEVPVSGWYELSVYAPYCYTRKADTEGAVYQVTHANGQNTIVVNQEANLGLWVSLGTYAFDAGHTGRVRLTDLTSTDSDAGVWFDAIRLLPVDVPLLPEVKDQQPAAGSWTDELTIPFSWTVSQPGAVTSQRLQVATDSAFNNLLLDQPLANSARSYTHTFGEDASPLYWRLLFHLVNDDQLASAVSQFGIDSTPPTSAVTRLYTFTDGQFLVTWQGEDAGSGIVSYNIEYREDGTAAWTLWQQETAATAARVNPPYPDRTYSFRSQAQDSLGNWQSLSANGDTNTGQALFLPHNLSLPSIAR